jgi:restriction system protein
MAGSEAHMARRKESGLDLIAALPWPVGIVLGVLAFWAARYGAGWYFSHNGGPLTAGLGQQLSAGALTPLGWMLLALCWIGAAVSFARRRQRVRLLATRTDLGSIAALDWRQFEQLVGEAFRRDGYAVEETGQGGADGGVDLVLRKGGRTTLVQCKRWRQRQVPVTTVREMWGLLAHYSADAVAIVCVGDYSPDARRFATNKAIRLITGEELVRMVRGMQAPTAATPATPARIEPAFGRAPDMERSADAAPPCPKCSGQMARRNNRQTGAAFWGCTNFPRCRGTRHA